MSKNLSTIDPATEPLRPGDGVRVTGTTFGMEDGYEGYVSRETPDNGDEYIVNITNAFRASDKGARLSYKRSHLTLTRRNGK